MKLLVFCLIVVANISDNGKASVDSFMPANANILLEDTTRSSDKSCHRPCKFNVKPRRCHYKFRVGPHVNDDDDKMGISINEMIPGPFINVCVNDIVVVEVTNKVPDQSLAVHWHGVEQKGTPYMDGVPMVTQCPIEFGSTYKYAFRASSPGTFFYHADAVSQQTDGVYGALVVNQPSPLEPHSSLYDYDRSHESTYIIAAEFPELMTGSLEDMSRAQPTSIKINGAEDFKLFVMAGFAYRLRMINAVGVECPVIISVDKHEMTVIAADGRPVKPAATGSVKMYPGERIDVVLRANQEPGGYWVRATGLDSCAGLQATSMLIYSGFNYTSMLLQKQPTQTEEQLLPQSVISGQILKSVLDVPLNDSEVTSVYLGIDRNVVKFRDTDVDFRYISDAIPKKPFFPASIALKQNGVVQINGKSFLYPNEPFLLRPRQVKPDLICKVGEESKNQEPQCIQILNVENSDVMEIALVNEGASSSESYTFHLHGYGMQIVATGQNPDHKPLTKDIFEKLDKDGKIIRNLINPPIKDTVTVPNKGYTLIRIKPEQIGAWMLECRSCGLSSLPTAVMIAASQPLPKSVIDNLPKCGSFRPPDVLLN